MLLPGVRHARTPLVAGSLWLFALWLMFGQSRLAPSRDADIIGKRLHDAYDLAGAAIGLGALALAALLIGGLIPTPEGRLGYVPDRISGRQRLLDVMSPWLTHLSATMGAHVNWSDIVENDNCPRVLAAWGKRHMGSTHPAEPVSSNDLKRMMTHAIFEEFDEHMDQIQVTRELLFNDLDRLQAEASLRFAVAAPLALCIGTAAYLSHSWIALGMVLPVALILQALVLQHEVRRKVVLAVQFGGIKSSSIDFLKSKSALAW